ncbi:MAG: M23 family metallopeptidase [Cyanobacteria bacterium J06629_19]
MTAPQHDENPPSNKENTQAIRRQKLQRCWFVAMGLLGGFGFVTSQMSFALAATDFLVSDAGQLATEDSFSADNLAEGSVADDYAAGSAVSSAVNSYVADGYAVADSYVAATTAAGSYTQSAADLTLNQPAFEVEFEAQSAAEPEAFIEAPSFASTEAAITTVESVPANVKAQQPEDAAFANQPVPVQSAHTQAAVSAAATSAEAVSAESQQSATTLDNLRNSDIANSPALTQQEASAQIEPGVQIEITAAVTDAGTGIVPTVTSAAPPTFTSRRKPAGPKIGSVAGNPFAALMEASAVAAPISAYASSQGILVSSVAEVAIADEAAFEAPAAEAVPEILPEPAPVAPPIVDIEPAVEAAPPITPVEVAPVALPEGSALPEEYDGIFVDPTDYSIGATEAPDVVVSEQSTGCEFTVGQNQGVPNGACGLPGAPAPVAEAPGAPAATASAPAWQEAPAAVTPVANEPNVNVGPVTFSPAGIQLSTSAAGRDYLNRSVRPLVNLQAAEKFIFPLAIPSPITSLFGFRNHPITGDYRFHAGTDIGAEQGTPVLAAQDGLVASANAAGGYGLMVVLRHQTEDLELESRYAHLAEIFVDAGTEVKKGDIIGLVGSTGNSTGPHLHFEMRQMTADGWVLVNPDALVQNSLANLVNALNNPMETLTFNLSDFNLSNLRARGSIKAPTTSIPTFPVGEDGIPFRPAQPNAS